MRSNILLSLVCMCLLVVLSKTIGAQSPPPVPVFVATVIQNKFTDEIEALGTLNANENVELNSSVTELITKINFDDGQRVNKGDVLVEMDAAQEKAEKSEEQARLYEARRQADRIKPLVLRKEASESLLDERQREVQTTLARLNAIQARISERTIIAPFSGVVGLRNVSVGALVQPGTLITTIDDDSVMKLDFAVPEVFLSSLTSGVEISATASAYPNQIFNGKVSSIDSRVNATSRSISVRALLNNDDLKLKPGMLMRVVVMKNARDALIVPEESILMDGNKHYVYQCLEKDNQTIVERRDIKIGSRREGEVEVLSGVDIGDQIVTHGALRLRPGSAVSIRAVEKQNENLSTLLKSNPDKVAE